MRQEAMHAQSGSASQAARVYILIKLNAVMAILAPSAVPLLSPPPSLAGGVSLAFSRQLASRGEHQSFRRWIHASWPWMTACQSTPGYASVITPAITQIRHSSSGGGGQPGRQGYLPSHDACRASVAQHRRFDPPAADDCAIFELSPVP